MNKVYKNEIPSHSCDAWGSKKETLGITSSIRYYICFVFSRSINISSRVFLFIFLLLVIHLTFRKGLYDLWMTRVCVYNCLLDYSNFTILEINGVSTEKTCCQKKLHHCYIRIALSEMTKTVTKKVVIYEKIELIILCWDLSSFVNDSCVTYNFQVNNVFNWYRIDLICSNSKSDEFAAHAIARKHLNCFCKRKCSSIIYNLLVLRNKYPKSFIF